MNKSANSIDKSISCIISTSDLWVVEECSEMVWATSSTERFHPLAVERGVMPALLEAENRSVDSMTDRQRAKVFAEVNKRHPSCPITDTQNNWCQTVRKRRQS